MQKLIFPDWHDFASQLAQIDRGYARRVFDAIALEQPEPPASTLPTAVYQQLAKIYAELLKKPGVGNLVERLAPWLDTLESVEPQKAWDYPLLETRVSGNPKADGVAWKLRANTNLGLGIDVLGATDMKRLDIIPDGKLVLRCLVDVKVGASAAASVPNFWNVKLTAGASADAKFDWYFAHPKDRRVVEVLAEDLPEIAAPWDLSACMKMARAEQFAQASFRFAGEMKFSAKASTGYSEMGYTYSLLDSTEKVPVGFKLGAEVTLALQHKGKYSLTLKPDGEYLVARLEALSKHESGIGLTIGADIVAGVVIKDVAQALNQTLPDVNGFLQRLDGWGDLRSLLMEELNRAIARSSDEKYMQEWLKALVGSSALSNPAGRQLATLAEGLQTRAQDTVDWLGVDFDPASGELRKDWLTQLGAEQLGDDAKSWLAKLAKRIQEGLEQRLSAAIKDATTDGAVMVGLRKFLEPIDGTVLQLIDKLIAGPAQHIQPVIAKLKEAAGKYQSWRAGLVDKLNQAAKERIGLDLSISAASSKRSNALLSVRFKSDTGVAEALYVAMWQGDLSDLQDRIAAATNARAIDQVEGQFAELLESSSRGGLVLHLLGETLSWQSIVTAKAQVETNWFGTCLVAGAAAEVTTVIQLFRSKSTQQAAVSATHRYGPGRTEIELGGLYSVENGELELDEFKEMLFLVARINGHADETVYLDQLGDLLSDPDRRSRTLKSMEVSAVLKLTADEVKIYRGRSTDEVRAIAFNASRDAATTARKDAGLDLAAFNDLLGSARDPEGWGNRTFSSLEGLLRCVWRDGYWQRHNTHDLMGALWPEAARSHDLTSQGLRKYREFGLACGVAQGLVMLHEELVRLLEQLEHVPRGQALSQDELFASAKRLAAALVPTARSAVSGGYKENLAPWPFAAYAKTLAALVGRAQNAVVVPVLRYEIDGKRKMVALRTPLVVD